jgi:DNA-directed RNA polymerase subunit RPC12/RpoP
MITKILIIALLILAGYFLRSWLYKSYSYKCPNCNKAFKPNTLQSILTFHFGGKRYLKCPHCDKKSMMQLVSDASDEKI